MNRDLWDIMNRALDDDIEPETWQAVLAHLDSAPSDAAMWNRMQDVDRLLRREPMAAPPPQFTARVMTLMFAEAMSAQRTDGFLLDIRLTIVALLGVAITLGVYFVCTRLFGPINLEQIVDQARALFIELGNLANLLVEWAEEYPMLPALGLASIPLAFAALWLAVYYTPRDRLRDLVQRRLSLRG